ncbi:hypothetical protein A9K75_06580 [Campylobacter fetus subsp. testudinum]|uniref:hypothetical protein n=1 Tax=Campylobacter fetus TaxID=196 RepID=UPI000818AC49|nr:hypothetical protein [Campylobacter fetus]OCR99531.1 hypothetical protein A9K75_06580 [Campylobacter fetus subsp. testudinum]
MKEKNTFELLGLIQPKKTQFTILYKTTNKLLEQKIDTFDEYKLALSNVLNYVSIFAKIKNIKDMELTYDEKLIALTYFYLFDSVNFYIYHSTIFKGIETPSANKLNEKIIANIALLDNDIVKIFIGQCYNNNLLRQLAY